MSRSSSGSSGAWAGACCCAFSRVGGSCLSGLRCEGSALATVPPRDQKSKHNVQSSKSRSQKPVSPRRRTQNCKSSQQHEAQSHHRHDRNGECASGHNSRTIQEQPCCWQRNFETCAEQQKCKERTRDQRRREAKSNFTRRPGKQRQSPAVRLPGTGEQADCNRHQTFGKPNTQPGKRRSLSGGQ